MIRVGMRSLTTTVKGQGLGSTYEELVHLLAERGGGEAMGGLLPLAFPQHGGYDWPCYV